MGNKHSSKGSSDTVTDARRLAWAMPSWCIDNYEVTNAKVELAAATWRYAMSGTSPPFLAAKLKEPSLTPLVFFYNQFYYFLFELLPDSRKLFTRGIKAQGRMLANVIKYIVTNMNGHDETIIKHSLEHLARVHNVKGIDADQYSVMGMCLLHTIRICTGTDYWTKEQHDAWTHIYSKMMAIIIPVVISGELPGQDEATEMAPAVAVYKAKNLNADADMTSAVTTNSHSDSDEKPNMTKTASMTHATTTSHVAAHPTTITGKTVHAVSHPQAFTTTCPGLSGTGTEDPDVSPALKEHFEQNAVTHMDTVAAEHLAERTEQKYKVLGRVLHIAQKVEMHLREHPQPAPMAAGTITGAELLHLLQAENWVSDAVGAQMAAAFFLQLHLMTRVSGPKMAPRVTTAEEDAIALRFEGDATVYSFVHAVASLDPAKGESPSSTVAPTTKHDSVAPGDGDLITAPRPRPAKSAVIVSQETDFNPQCFLENKALVPVDSILHALSPVVQLHNIDG